MTQARGPILVLGGGITGAAIARQLALAGLSVCVVDSADIAGGTTAYSSRLIHGGLRYLEYAQLRLVHESLQERTRLLRLAPHLVQPLRLFIPLESRFGGLTQAIRRFMSWESGETPQVPRGVWLVALGLWWYDWLARGSGLPGHQVYPVNQRGLPPVDRQRYRWLCSYYDAQIRYPERLVVAYLRDAQQIAQAHGAEFQLFTYHRAALHGTRVEVIPEPARDPAALDRPLVPSAVFQPAAVINATGAWVDHTLAQWKLDSRQRIGGTKGSHFVSFAPRLRQRLGKAGLYAEADDGRPIFVLPFGAGTLVGTTDVPFTGRPETAVATTAELEYLRSNLNRILPGLALEAGEIDLHYAGVRPLPKADAITPGAISRDFQIEHHRDATLPLLSIFGGKLTTARAMAEACAETLFATLQWDLSADSRDRPVPGGNDYPPDEPALLAVQNQLAATTGSTLPQVQAAWSLLGTDCEPILRRAAGRSPVLLAGTDLPLCVVQWIVDNEWPRRIGDLVERRLMLHLQPDLSDATLVQLGEMLRAAGRMDAAQLQRDLAAVRHRLAVHFGRRLPPADAVPDAHGG